MEPHSALGETPARSGATDAANASHDHKASFAALALIEILIEGIERIERDSLN